VKTVYHLSIDLGDNFNDKLLWYEKYNTLDTWYFILHRYKTQVH